MTLTILKNLVLIFFNLPVVLNFSLCLSFACYKFGVKGVFESKCLFASDGVLLSKPRRKMTFPIYLPIYDKRWMDWMTTDWMMTIGWLNLRGHWMNWMTMDGLDDNEWIGWQWIGWIELDKAGNGLDDDDSSAADSICEVIGCGANWTEWWINYLAAPTPTSSTTLFSL